MNMDEDARVAVRDGAVVGYVDVGDRSGEGKILWIDVRADDEALSVLLDFAEHRASEKGAEGGKAKAWSPEHNTGWRNLLESRGFVFDSFSRRMRIALDRSAAGAGVAGRDHRPHLSPRGRREGRVRRAPGGVLRRE